MEKQQPKTMNNVPPNSCHQGTWAQSSTWCLGALVAKKQKSVTRISRFRFGLLFLICCVALACNESKPSDATITQEAKGKPLFTLLDSAESGFFFWNEVKEDETFNSLTYEYYYNGAGVAVGDINNDGLPDIFMGGNRFGGRLFLNLGKMKFKQISDQAGVYNNGFTTGITMADVNADGYMDIYLCRSLSTTADQRRNILLINNKNLTFTDRAKEYGLDDAGYSNHASFFDYDADGDLDMFLLNHRADFENALYLYPEKDWKGKLAEMARSQDSVYQYYSNKLYRNNGDQTFTDITVSAGLASFDFGLSATIADIDLNGRPDIYTTSDYATKDHLYINLGNGKFEDRIDVAVGHISKNSMGSDVADYNNDGLPDIVTLDMMSEDNFRQKQLKGYSTYDIFQITASYGLHYQVMRNCLQLNTGAGTFSEIGQFAGISHTDWSWAPLLADFDNDGLKDLMITNGYARDVTDMDYIKYRSPEIVRKGGGPQTVKSMDLLKEVPSTPLKNYIFKNRGDLQFQKMTDDWGLTQTSFSNGAAYADLDLDGDLDLIVNNYNQAAFLYRNEAKQLHPEQHTLGIRLKGNAPNTFALGAKVWVTNGDQTQYQELFTSRGFLSSVQSDLNFGLGEKVNTIKVKVRWPNGKYKVFDQVKPDQLLEIKPGDGLDHDPGPTIDEVPLFARHIGSGLPTYVHEENGYIDFKTDALLEYAVSQAGPWITVGDVNGDNKDDFYIGGSAGKPGSLFIQASEGDYRLSRQPAFAQQTNFKDGESLFFDADGDGDNDLFVTSFAHEANQPQNYGCRLYLNDGKGQFTYSADAIPQWSTPSQSAVAVDFDGDRDSDLFVGGAAIPGQYPYAGRSYFLKNEKGKFSIADLLPNQGKLGILNKAIAADLNGDKTPELVLGGSWEPIKILQLENGKWTNQTEAFGLRDTDGLWYSLAAADLDNDGDLDLVAGNRGTNFNHKVSEEKPGVLSYSDLDGNGSLEGLISYPYPDGHLHPKYAFDELVVQAPGLKSRFTSYKSYSEATTETVVGPENWAKAPKWYLKQAASLVLLNDGKGHFTTIPLNPEAQIFPVKDIAIADWDEDEKLDLLLVGNHYAASPDIGREDAGHGLFLKGLGNGKFIAIPAVESGIQLPMDTRQIFLLKNGAGVTTVGIGSNQGPLVFLMGL
ncbi:MAG: VCBS repeat-containing protein [Bacteroidetes bacterium]|nr:VCBS repeat-containing protein [Bacteroidota bacterium]